MTVTSLHRPANPTAEPTIGELATWVQTWFVDILERRASNSRRWCARWFEHPEAVTRLRILMLSHRQVVEHGDALAMSAWMLDHLDRHLAALHSADGPFAACSIDRHSTHRGLVVEPIGGRS